MERVLFSLNGTPIAVADVFLAVAALALYLLAVIARSLARRGRTEREETYAAVERQREILHALVDASERLLRERPKCTLAHLIDMPQQELELLRRFR